LFFLAFGLSGGFTDVKEKERQEIRRGVGKERKRWTSRGQ
jgi:hypothetical protein